MIGRVRTRREFASLATSPCRARSGPLAVRHVPAAEGAACVAYAVGRAVGPAVVRNRVRRRLRACVAQLDRVDPAAPGLYLLSARPEVVDCTQQELLVHVRRALAGLRRP